MTVEVNNIFNCVFRKRKSSENNFSERVNYDNL